MEARKRLAAFPLAILLGILPLYVGAVGRYGQKVLAMLALSLLTGLCIDLLANRLRGEQNPRWSWLIWIVYPLALPPGAPLWVVPSGLAFCLIFGVHFFGGYGRTIFPVAAVGVVFLALSYPSVVNIVTKPFDGPTLGFSRFASQVPIAGTVFSHLRTFADIPPKDFLFGQIPGNVGESYGAYLIALGLVMVLAGYLDPRFALPAVAGLAAFSWLGRRSFPGAVLGPEDQLLAGSFLLYLAVFVPSDPFCLPHTPAGRWAGGLLFAFFTVLIRSFSGFSEGVFFAALLTSVFSPLIDQVLAGRLYRRSQGTP